MKRFLCAIYFLTLTQALAAESPANAETEGRAIAECLERYGGVTPENAERLQRYKQWSDSYEEIPCFTKCYLTKMYDIYNDSMGFSEENVIKQFGPTLFAVCKKRLINRQDDDEDECKSAYSGFHCLVSLENDPFVYIESLPGLDTEVKSTMKECLHRFDQYEWTRLPEFSKLPMREPIPCFTKCVADRLQLFNERTKQWNTEKIQMKLGLELPTDDHKQMQYCQTSNRRRSRNVCSWMFKEMNCFARLSNSRVAMKKEIVENKE